MYASRCALPGRSEQIFGGQLRISAPLPRRVTPPEPPMRQNSKIHARYDESIIRYRSGPSACRSVVIHKRGAQRNTSTRAAPGDYHSRRRKPREGIEIRSLSSWVTHRISRVASIEGCAAQATFSTGHVGGRARTPGVVSGRLISTGKKPAGVLAGLWHDRDRSVLDQVNHKRPRFTPRPKGVGTRPCNGDALFSARS